MYIGSARSDTHTYHILYLTTATAAPSFVAAVLAVTVTMMPCFKTHTQRDTGETYVDNEIGTYIKRWRKSQAMKLVNAVKEGIGTYTNADVSVCGGGAPAL